MAIFANGYAYHCYWKMEDKYNDYIVLMIDKKKYILELSNDIRKISRKSEIDLQNHNTLYELTEELHSLLIRLLHPELYQKSSK